MSKDTDETTAIPEVPEGQMDGLTFIRTSPGLSRTWELLRQRGERNEALRQAAAKARKTGGGNTNQAG